MSALYWLTVLGRINSLALTLVVMSGIALIVLAIAYVYSVSGGEEPPQIASRRSLKITFSVFVLSVLTLVFVPNFNQLCLIYGVGGTVDYLKNNETVRRLPDKYIKVLDQWADEQLSSDRTTDTDQTPQ